MDIHKEREAFERLPLAELAIKSEYVYYNEETNSYWPNEDFCPSDAPETMNFAWEAWQAAKAQAVPEGFVLVPMVPSERMINAVRQCYEGEAYLPYSLYSEFVNQAIIERMEAQEPAND
ncbi:hypothetical protein [Acinetobacter sp. YH12069]|uniref:hypothetical protein n=1 Tax=Acinetobacter sp. YH12069 TaxID=2601065 RepID=UPI0015D1870E|nr:hypothetical protein [Acinetobacter sp. YH12069]